ncbi:MAG: Na/Pi symporter [Christensenellaceae bacterium]|nr:Na/Pi symporter [Christensenellaceae bacterium]
MFAGLGVFLIGMQLISHNMQKLAGNKISAMLVKISDNRLAGIGIGAGAAALLESSSATTVILLGLVNAGIVTLLQATLIIMGANIGTTFTMILLSFSYLPIGEILSFVSLIGAAIIMGAKKDKTRMLGLVIGGLGLIFAGIEIMSGGVDFLKSSSVFVDIVASVSNPFMLVLVGLLASGTIQSGTAVCSVAITLCEAGIMPTVSAFYIILGSNIGTCTTALIAAIGTNANTKRTALIHLIFNVAGVIIFMPLIWILEKKFPIATQHVLSPAVIIAYFHIIFNVATTIILIPFVKKLVRISEILIKDQSSTCSY